MTVSSKNEILCCYFVYFNNLLLTRQRRENIFWQEWRNFEFSQKIFEFSWKIEFFAKNVFSNRCIFMKFRKFCTGGFWYIFGNQVFSDLKFLVFWAKFMNLIQLKKKLEFWAKIIRFLGKIGTIFEFFFFCQTAVKNTKFCRFRYMVGKPSLPGFSS